MMQTIGGKQQSGFSHWLRTGRLPRGRTGEGVERKFNPWHDPENGQFTFAGSGRYYGAGGAGRAPGTNDRDRLKIAATQGAQAPRRPAPESRPGDRSNPAAEFVGGVGQGLRDVAKRTAAEVYSALTTNPATTVRNAGRGIARSIDAAIAAEDTPARVQIARAANAVANASPREIGRATGSVVGNAAVAVVPGAAASKVSALRRLRNEPPSVIYEPLDIGWVKENLGRESPAKQYNDAATGARPGQAPTLMRPMPDGSERPVKFDGVQGEYVIDRKLKVVNAPRARAQLLRQSQALAHNRLIGTWEVPNPVQRVKALKLLKNMNITNIKVRVVKP